MGEGIIKELQKGNYKKAEQLLRFKFYPRSNRKEYADQLQVILYEKGLIPFIVTGNPEKDYKLENIQNIELGNFMLSISNFYYLL